MSLRSADALAAALAVLLAGSWLATAAPVEPVAAQIQPARPFGYRIGDEIRLDVRVPVPGGYAFDTEAAPKPGRVNAFLELRGVERHAGVLDWIERKPEQRFTVRFLVVNSAPSVRLAATPALNLPFWRSGAPPIEVVLPETNFALSPLSPDLADGLLTEDGLRGDIPAPRVSMRGSRLRLLGYLAIAVGCAVVLAWRQGWLPRRLLTRRPFAQAATEIARLGRDTEPAVQAMRARRLHHAFDMTAGFAVAQHTLDHFLGGNPHFARLEPQIRGFFAASSRFFYAGQAGALDDPVRLRQLARALAECEARRGARQ